MATDRSSVRVDIAKLWEYLAEKDRFQEEISMLATDELRALLDAVGAAWSYWCDPTPDNHHELDRQLARFDFGEDGRR